MFASKTRPTLKTLVFAALVLSVAAVAPTAEASPSRNARQANDFVFAFKTGELLDAQEAQDMDKRLRRDVRRYCRAGPLSGLTLIAESACRQKVMTAARRALAQKSLLARNGLAAG